MIYAICNSIGERKKLCCFDIKERKLRDLNIVVPQDCQIIQIINRIYVTGGKIGSTIVNNVSEFVESSKSFIQKKSDDKCKK